METTILVLFELICQTSNLYWYFKEVDIKTIVSFAGCGNIQALVDKIVSILLRVYWILWVDLKKTIRPKDIDGLDASPYAKVPTWPGILSTCWKSDFTL